MGKKLWADGEVYMLIDFLGSNLEAYTTGVKERFYENAKNCLEGQGYEKSTTQIKSKLTEIESSCKSYKLKLSTSGYGVKETDSQGIKAMLERKCLFYYEMDEILGARHNTTPPIIMEPGRMVLSGVEQPKFNEILNDSQLCEGQQNEGTVKAPTPKRTTPTKRPFDTAHASSLHDALLFIHREKGQHREKRRKEEAEYRQAQIAIQKEQVMLQREELRLREKKMDQQFQLMLKQLENERVREENKNGKQ